VTFQPNQTLATNQIVSPGSILIESTSTAANVPGVVVSNGSKLTANDGNIQVQSNSPSNSLASGTSASLNMPDTGNGDVFSAIGGNVVVLAKGSIQGGNNTYQAEGSTGIANGGIEIAGGTTVNTLGAAFLKLPTQPANLAVLGPTVSNPGSVSSTHGVILANIVSGGSVNLSGAANTAVPILTLNHGAMVFGAGASGVTVTLNGGTFKTSSVKPIAEVTLELTDDIVIDTGDDADDLLVLAP
jgi:hypothetical protein